MVTCIRLTRVQVEELAEQLTLPAAKLALRFKGVKLGQVDKVLPSLLRGAKELLLMGLEESPYIFPDEEEKDL